VRQRTGAARWGLQATGGKGKKICFSTTSHKFPREELRGMGGDIRGGGTSPRQIGLCIYPDASYSINGTENTVVEPLVRGEKRLADLLPKKLEKPSSQKKKYSICKLGKEKKRIQICLPGRRELRSLHHTLGQAPASEKEPLEALNLPVLRRRLEGVSRGGRLQINSKQREGLRLRRGKFQNQDRRGADPETEATSAESRS